jgi:hypothetical protein
MSHSVPHSARFTHDEQIADNSSSWTPEALRILRDESPNIDVMISRQYSPSLDPLVCEQPASNQSMLANQAGQTAVVSYTAVRIRRRG